jgi:hypothetical protein
MSKINYFKVFFTMYDYVMTDASADVTRVK